ncbi:hypothetical protein ACH4NO_18285 [Streptomyces olivaceus]|uniref:hypothetical protein n=1 Tax=Streptomyces olivaceus TaxID=47716 RepID=UPI003787A28C
MSDRHNLPQPPATWPEEVRTAFWGAVNAPTYTESAAATLAFAHQLAEMLRDDVDLKAHPGEAIYECEGCATVRAANAIDPEDGR